MSLFGSSSTLLSRILSGCALVFLAAASSACGLDGVDSGPISDGPIRIPADEPAVDDRLDALEIICESTLIVTGTYLTGDPQPDGLNGCWPIGTWTVSATVDRLGCDPQPDLLEDMVYVVSYDEEASSHNVSFSNDPADERVNLKISTSGDGLCHGTMDHFGVDGTVWSFRPTLQEDGTLLGIGTYSVHQEDPF